MILCNRSNNNELIYLHELLDVIIKADRKVLVGGFGCQGEDFLFFVNLDLYTNETCTRMFSVHVELEDGSILLISGGHH